MTNEKDYKGVRLFFFVVISPLPIRLFWLLIIMAAIRGMLFLGQYQYDRYRANPTAIQMDKNYRDWIGIMPGLTFCFHDRIDWNRAWEYLER